MSPLTQPHIRRVLEELRKANNYALNVSCCPWNFAIPIRHLHSLGASETDLRWLVLKTLVEHAREVTVEGDDGRAFRATENLTFCQQTCFVLTKLGAEQFDEARVPTSASSNNGKARLEGYRVAPEWEPVSRRLSLDGLLVKWFKWPASNQELVLAAFQEDAWPERIDDPLAPRLGQDSKRRLADTIKCLNKHQKNELVRFRGDGTGEGVLWETPVLGTPSAS